MGDKLQLVWWAGGLEDVYEELTDTLHSSYNKRALSCQVNACRIERSAMRRTETPKTGNRAEVVSGRKTEQAGARSGVRKSCNKI